MSIKKKIVFKNPVAQELRTPKYKSKVIESKKKYERDRPRFEEHDEEDYIEHCRKFFKGEVE